MERALLIQNVINFGDEDIHDMNGKYGYKKYVQTEDSPMRSKLELDEFHLTRTFFEPKKKPESQRAILSKIKKTKSKLFS